MDNAIKYPANKPVEHGYYVTKYWNVQVEAHLYKAFWWDGVEFGGWRLPINECVVEFYPATYDLHYVPSMMKAGI